MYAIGTVWDAIGTVSAAVAAVAALAALVYAGMTLREAAQARVQAHRDSETELTDRRALNREFELARTDELLVEIRLEQLRQLDRVSEIVDEITRAAIEEIPDAADSDADAISKISSLGQRLIFVVGAFRLTGGSDLSSTEDFALRAIGWKKGKAFRAYSEATLIASEIHLALHSIKLDEVLQRIAARTQANVEAES